MKNLTENKIMIIMMKMETINITKKMRKKISKKNMLLKCLRESKKKRKKMEV